jgi:hypothetical protein
MLETTFTVREIIERIAHHQCLVCHTNLDLDFKKKDWHIPLCIRCRTIALKEMFP